MQSSTLKQIEDLWAPEKSSPRMFEHPLAAHPKARWSQKQIIRLNKELPASLMASRCYRDTALVDPCLKNIQKSKKFGSSGSLIACHPGIISFELDGIYFYSLLIFGLQKVWARDRLQTSFESFGTFGRWWLGFSNNAWWAYQTRSTLNDWNGISDRVLLFEWKWWSMARIVRVECFKHCEHYLVTGNLSTNTRIAQF